MPPVLDDTFPVYSGLFNEVISSSLSRYSPPAPAPTDEPTQEENKNDGGEDGEFVVLASVKKSGGEKKELPSGLEESLLQTMTQVKREQMLLSLSS